MRKTLVVLAIVVSSAVLVIGLGVGRSTAMRGATRFTAVLNAGQEVPPTSSTALGVALVHLKPTASGPDVCWAITYHELSAAEAGAHIHSGRIGKDGPIEIDLGTGNPKSGCADITRRQIDLLRQGRLYINIHTVTNPDGEIRGQILK